MKPATEFPKNFSLLKMAQKKAEATPKPPPVDSKDMCLMHHKKLEVICVDHQIRIWTNCALFGDHKNHDIREETEVINEITARTELLIDIYELIEANRANMEQLKEVDGLYNNFRAKQNAVEKFKEYTEELVRKQREFLHVIENNFESLERDFYEIQRGPKKVLEAAEQWSSLAQQKMDTFNKSTTQDVKWNSAEYIAFEMLEDQNSPEDIIKMGEKVLEDLADHSEMPVTRISDQLGNLSRQFDQHFKSKLLVMLDVLNSLAETNSSPSPSITTLKSKQTFEKYSMNTLKEPVAKPAAIKSSPLTKPLVGHSPKTSTLKQPSIDKNLLEDDNDLLGDFTLNDKSKEDNDLVGQTSDINFLNDIPDPTADEIDPSIIGDTDKAYDVISKVLEDGLDNLDLSNRKLGDNFFESMIESIIDFAEGEPLSVINLNMSNNDITDEGCDKILEFLIIEKDASAANIKYVDLSGNKIKDKSIDMILALWEENIVIETIDFSKNHFMSKLVINKLKGIKNKMIML
jgi:hypothetical protein